MGTKNKCHMTLEGQGKEIYTRGIFKQRQKTEHSTGRPCWKEPGVIISEKIVGGSLAIGMVSDNASDEEGEKLGGGSLHQAHDLKTPRGGGPRSITA